MNEEEVAALIAGKIEELETRHKAEVEALQTKNAQLITEKQNVKAAADAAAAAVEREKAEKKGDVESLKALHANELQRLQTMVEEREAQNKSLIAGAAVKAAMAKANVVDSAFDVFASHFEGRATIVDGRAVIDGLPVETVIADHFGKDANRSLVRAPANGGMSTTGSTDTTTHSWTKAPVTGDEMTKWFAVQESNPALANSLADSWGRPELRA